MLLEKAQDHFLNYKVKKLTINMAGEIEPVGGEEVAEEVAAETTADAPEEKPKLTPEQEEAQLLGRVNRLRTKQGKPRIGEEKPEPKVEPKNQPNEPDYGRLAYLNSEGINHSDDQKFVQEEANRLQLPLTEVRNMDHVKSRLQANKDQREALAGTPKGTGRSGGKTQHDVDYWLSKDGDERPSDPELAVKVLQAKMAKEKSANQFSDMMYN